LFISLLHDREQQSTLLTDALDESQEPRASVLQRIAAQPDCRVIVGTRTRRSSTALFGVPRGERSRSR
jgi:hypothetical protein